MVVGVRKQELPYILRAGNALRALGNLGREIFAKPLQTKREMSESEKPRPTFRELGHTVCEEILSRNHVGRVAFTFQDHVDIEPIHYVFSYGWIYGRTSHGTKLSVIAHHRWVAFEVDETEGIFDWRSVVVKGAFEIVNADTSTHQDPAFTQGVALLRSFVPETLTADDPVPFRGVMFRIHLDEVTGREARSKPV